MCIHITILKNVDFSCFFFYIYFITVLYIDRFAAAFPLLCFLLFYFVFLSMTVISVRTHMRELWWWNSGLKCSARCAFPNRTGTERCVWGGYYTESCFTQPINLFRHTCLISCLYCEFLYLVVVLSYMKVKCICRNVFFSKGLCFRYYFVQRTLSTAAPYIVQREAIKKKTVGVKVRVRQRKREWVYLCESQV